MNKTAIRRVATALLTGELATRKRGKQIGYNQGHWMTEATTRFPDMGGHACGTTACIAGHACAIFSPRTKVGGMYDTAAKLFGLGLGKASDLFNGYPNGFGSDRKPTAKQAALVLFHLAETGKVDWQIAR